MSDGNTSSGRIDWKPVKAYYLAHPELSAKDVAQYFELNVVTVQQKFVDEGLSEIRQEIEKESSRMLVNQIVEKSYKEKDARLSVLSTLINKFLDDPSSKVTDAGVIAAIKQIGLMLGEVTQRTEQTVLVYEVSTDAFPAPKIIEGDADLIEGDFEDLESPPQLNPPTDGQSEES